MKFVRNISFRNKLLFSFLAVILLLSAIIALFARWILISSLTSELEKRGIGIAYSVADLGRSAILTENRPELTSLVFDTRFGERKALVEYVFILNKNNVVLAHSFTRPFPDVLIGANPLVGDQSRRIQLLHVEGRSIYDVAVPVTEGIYRIGTIHVGLKKEHIDNLIDKLRTTFVGFISINVVIFFFISRLTSEFVTRPIRRLTLLADEVSRGNLDVRIHAEDRIECWKIKDCDNANCLVHGNPELTCWYFAEFSPDDPAGKDVPLAPPACQQCHIYNLYSGDEIDQLSRSFNNMIHRLKMSETEKNLQAQAVRESERKYRLLINNIPNIVFRGYLDGAIDYFDDKIEAMTGFSKEEFLSREKTWFDMVHEEDLPAAQRKLIQALKTNHSYIREYRIKTKDKGLIWIQEGGQIIFGEDGKAEYITGAFLNITERMVAEKALEESEREYRSLFNSGPNPIFVLDAEDFTILDANPSAEETYECPRSELLNRSFLDFGPLDNAELKSILADIPDGPHSRVIGNQVLHLTHLHKPFYARVTACPTRYRERRAIIIAVMDITEMLEKDVQLIQASKMKTLGELSAGIAHELNQPLNAIKMGNEFLHVISEREGPVRSDQILQVAKEVSEQVDRASDIINLLREFGRKPDIKTEPVDLNEPVRTVLRIIGRQLALDSIGVILDLADDLPLIMAQKNRLEQVFLNLITNARDAIMQKRESGRDEDKAKITIRTFKDAGRVAVTVADTGTGIPENQMEKIFEPFFTTREVGKGMGLGLSIVYGIVKEYGGLIEVKSQPGQGAAIKQSFPAVES